MSVRPVVAILSRTAIFPLIFAFCLLVPVGNANAANSSHLNWGKLPSWDGTPTEKLPADIQRAIEVAGASLDMEIRPVDKLYLAGTLTQDPRHVESDKAKGNFPAIFDLAICARVAQEPLRTQCLDKATSALLAWAQTYQPTGNPIDEGNFTPLFQSIDLVAPKLPTEKSRVLEDWLRSFVIAGDNFYAPLWPRHSFSEKSNQALSNNWMAWHLLLRAMAATICDDKHLEASSRTMLTEFADRNFISTNGQQDGKTFDFVVRDAIHYQMYDLLPLVEIVLYAPSLVDSHTYGLIDRGLNFIKPFYTGQEQHIEFVHSNIAFDIQRKQQDKNSSVFENKPWDPKRARILFRLARPAFPDIQPWTIDVVDTHYDTWIKPLTAIYGEPLSAQQ